ARHGDPRVVSLHEPGRPRHALGLQARRFRLPGLGLLQGSGGLMKKPRGLLHHLHQAPEAGGDPGLLLDLRRLLLKLLRRLPGLAQFLEDAHDPSSRLGTSASIGCRPALAGPVRYLRAVPGALGLLWTLPNTVLGLALGALYRRHPMELAAVR